MNYSTALQDVLHIARAAGDAMMTIYKDEFDVITKADGSPLTAADQAAHEVIVEGLQRCYPDIPVLSEESDKSVLVERLQWSRYFLVDPLDGTKEFVKRNGEFTVNIALIENHQPVLGVVVTPDKGWAHYGARDLGAWNDLGAGAKAISCRPCAWDNLVMVASRSHSSGVVDTYQQRLREQKSAQISLTSMGSSLKICLVAEASADIYPRFAPTSEWDTAAADAVLRAAGGAMIDLQGQPLRYNKPDILNPWFIALGDSSILWSEFAEGLQA